MLVVCVSLIHDKNLWNIQNHYNTSFLVRFCSIFTKWVYHTVQLIICAFIIKRREMLINCNPLTFYWCAQICNIHKLQPIRIPNSSSTVFISILFLYTAHNALPFLQSRLVHCMFQRSSSIDYDQAYYCRTHKAKP